jgi:hypothetical protein
MKPILQKRKTKQEIDEASLNGDLTGGYNFISWLVYLRPFYVLAAISNFIIGCGILKTYNEYQETITGLSAIFFGLLVPAVIITLLVREFKNKKKGISQ